MSSEPWFYSPRESWQNDLVVLDPDESRHAATVLHVASPDIITVTDGAGAVARCSVTAVEEGRIVAEVLEQTTRPRPRPEIAVYQGAARGHKLDGAIERLAELGVAETSVFHSLRSVVRWDASKSERRAQRWRAIARSAAKQSRSPWLMKTGPVLGWDELLMRLTSERVLVAPWEEATLPLRAALTGPAARVALIIGPEGGLSQDEANALADRGARLVSLGPQILRTENAPVVAAALVMFHYGLIG
jgi:16S rRNA (uracil1498-N3)-methyltransferase